MRSVACILAVFVLAGCESLAASMAAAGATAVLGAQFNGIAYRTFTAPLPMVKHASMAALENMGMTPESSDALEAGELIVARAGGRRIEIELEALTPRATRMRVATRDGALFHDAATATEIVAQTQKALEAPAAALARDAKRITAVE